MRPTGFCPVCGELRHVTKESRVLRHTGNKRGVWPPESCDGTGQVAVKETPA